MKIRRPERPLPEFNEEDSSYAEEIMGDVVVRLADHLRTTTPYTTRRGRHHGNHLSIVAMNNIAYASSYNVPEADEVLGDERLTVHDRINYVTRLAVYGALGISRTGLFARVFPNAEIEVAGVVERFTGRYVDDLHRLSTVNGIQESVS